MNNSLQAQRKKISDEEVVARILRGEKDFYEIIIRRYNPKLYRIGMSIVKDPHDAEDAMQNAYIKAYENLSKFEWKSSFSTWLVRILVNESLLTLKKKKRIEIMQGEEDNMEYTYSTDMSTPLQSVLNSETKELLQQSVDNLPDKYRTVFVMREIEEMSVAETMECLGLSESNVKVRLNRAKEMLRESLSGHYRNSDIYSFHLTRCDNMVRNVLSQII